MKYATEENYAKLEKALRSKTVIALGIVLTVLSFFIVPALVVIPGALYFALKKALKQKNFMLQYAQKNNLHFEYQKELEFPARLFKLGGKSKTTILNLIHGSYQEHPIKLFNHSYSTGSGKSRKVHSFTVCEIEISDTRFPFILLKSNSMLKHAGSSFFGYKKDFEIKLEEEFAKSFNLYCRSDYEIEVLQILDTELLRYLVQHGNKFSIEFAENKIYIYDDEIITTNKEMDEIFSIVKHIIEKSGPLLKRLKNDFEALHEFYDKK